MNRIRKFFQGIDQAANLGHRCAELESRNADLLNRISTLEARISKEQRENSLLKAEVEKVKTKVREQTEADLVLTSLKIVLRAVQGATKESLGPLVSIQAQQMAAMQNVSPAYYANFGGVLGALGGGFGQQS